MRGPLLVGVSDVGLGYGSPQIVSFMHSLQDVYGGEMVVFEPDQSERPSGALGSLPRGRVERITQVYHPHRERAGRIEYIVNVAGRLNALRPRILVIFCTYSLPALLKLRYRPDMVIYYSIESVAAYGDFDVEMNRRLARLMDLVIFPEENRAILDVTRCRLRGVPVAILYNCAYHGTGDQAVHPRERNNRILYAGTIDRVRTLADYFLDERMRGVPIDLFGHITGWDQPGAFLAKLPAETRYGGYLDGSALRDVRGRYAYNIVMWNPTDENQLYAAPNKFFESIADGVPPIAAPHPQCKMLIDRYGCGIAMEGWDFPAFRAALLEGLRLLGTPAYDEMVENCGKAVHVELSWERQFDKIRRYLRPVS